MYLGIIVILKTSFFVRSSSRLFQKRTQLCILLVASIFYAKMYNLVNRHRFSDSTMAICFYCTLFLVCTFREFLTSFVSRGFSTLFQD